VTALLNPADWERVMVLAAHPDDETLATGGLLQQAGVSGAAVRVIFVTDGDNNPWPQRVIERRWRITPADRARWGARRRGEALAALTRLGVPTESAVFLGYPDQGLTRILLAREEEPLARLAAEIATWCPTLLVTPSTLDLHPDHNALAVLLRLALGRLERGQRRFAAISYCVHDRQPTPVGSEWLHLRLRPEEQTRKRQAILCHASQLVLSRRRFLAFAKDVEWFIASSEPSERDEHHPVRHAVMTKSTLRFAVVRRTQPRAFGRTTLYVVAGEPHRGGATLSVALPWTSVTVSVRNEVSGAVVTQARFCGNRRQGEILLPLSALPPAERVFIKVARRFGFFDEAGWREIPVPRPSRQSAPLPAISPRAAWLDPAVCCVIPCYNIAVLCGEVVREAALHTDHVIAVDDGSTDTTGQVLRGLAAESNGRITVLSFARNQGKGVALLAAFRHALAALPFDVLVTLDGDCQHRPADIPQLVRTCIDEGAALVIGERGEFAAMPLRSRLGNTLTTALLRKLYPASPFDTQSGLRALERSFVEEVVRVVTGRRYEAELQILLLALGQQRRICTIPIPTVYLNSNCSSHFRPIADSLRIYRTILGWRLRGLQNGASRSEPL